MTDRTRVSGPGGTIPSTVGDKSAEDGFQKVLGQRLDVPVVGKAPSPGSPGARAKPQLPPRTPAGPASPAQQQANQQQAKTQAPAPRVAPVDTRDNDRGGRFSGLGDRLVDLRKSLGVTQVELARRMGSTQPAMARIEKGDLKPNLRTLARYGEAIGQRVEVTFSDISGRRDTALGVGRVPIDEVPDALAQVRRELGVTQAQVATAMETSQPVIARLESGEAVPNLRTLERYCDALGVEPVISFAALEPIDTSGRDADDATS